jgi:hypothetical protein
MAMQIPVDAAMLERARTEKGMRLLLVLDGVRLDFTEGFSVRVFLDHPLAGPGTPPEDPHFVGSFASFHHDHGQGAAKGRFVLDAGPTIERLGIEQGPVGVDLVLVPFGDRPQSKRELELGGVELQLAREVIDVAAQ